MVHQMIECHFFHCTLPTINKARVNRSSRTSSLRQLFVDLRPKKKKPRPKSQELIVNNTLIICSYLYITQVNFCFLAFNSIESSFLFFLFGFVEFFFEVNDFLL